MRAQQLHDLSGPDGLRLVDVDEPDGDGRVLIDVQAAGVSFPDLLLTRGLYQLKPPLPFVPGAEVSGTVRSAPAGSGFKNGDQVAAFTMLGGFAEVAAADPALTTRFPTSLSMEAAGGFILNHHTAHFALARRGRVQPGELVAVHGAAGGIGTAAIQVARGLGARVVAVAGGPEKAAGARRAGAEAVVDAASDWVSELRALAGGRGADVILDPVGGDRFDQSLRCLAPEGRLLVVGFTEGRIPQVQVNRLLLRNIDVVGVAWGAFLALEPALFAETQLALDAMLESGTVAPLVTGVLPLERLADALRRIESRSVTGKLVVTPRG